MIQGEQMTVRKITDDDIAFWKTRGEWADRVEMRGDHIGATNIEVLRCRREMDDAFPECWRVPFVVPGGDGTTYWFSMFSDGFPPVAGVTQPGGRQESAAERSSLGLDRAVDVRPEVGQDPDPAEGDGS